jgi:pimeloyl-ACP methyl ester carboxylesterase
MSNTAIYHYFENRPVKGSLHSYQTSDGRTIRYLHVGDEELPLVIFVHGSPGSLDAFIGFMSDSSLLKSAQLISVDRPGFGYSNFGLAEPSLQRQAAMLKPLLDLRPKGRQVILVGHSMGGPVIARMAMDYPELVDGLVFVAASVDPQLEPDETWFRAPLATPFLRWILPRSMRASNDEIYHLKPELQEMLPLWQRITAPVTVIQGDKDSLVPAANADFAKKMLTHASSVRMIRPSAVDHFIPWSNPELIHNGILQLLNPQTPGR